MATFSGVMSASARQATANRRSKNMNLLNVNQDRRAYASSKDVTASTRKAPIVEVVHRGRAGMPFEALMQYVYNRIHINTRLVALGSVASAQETTVYVWSAYFTPKILTGLEVGDVDGISVRETQLPLGYGPLDEVSFTILVDSEGSPEIDTNIIWTFNNGQDVILHITGSRIAFWGFNPTWEGGITERLEWLTNVLSSPLSIEQRRALRLSPRRFFQVQLIAKPSERSYMDMIVMNWGARRWAIPIWPDVQFIDSAAEIGATEILCDTVGRDFQVGSLLALRGVSATDFELAEVSEILPDRVKVLRPLQQTWPINTKVMPVRTALFSEQPQFTRLTDNSASVSASFQIVEACDWPAIPPVETYRDKPLYLEHPEESENLTTTYQRVLEFVDNATGVPRNVDTAGLGFTIQGHRWLLNGRAKQAAMRSLWYYLRGKQRSMWIPTHSMDFIVVEPIEPNTRVVTVEATGYVDYGAMLSGRRDILITLTNGQYFARRITSTEKGTGVERLYLDEDVSTTSIPVASIQRVSFLVLSRLDQDFIEIRHETDSDGTASTNGTWRSLRDDLGEV